jgi:hypothetical protein
VSLYRQPARIARRTLVLVTAVALVGGLAGGFALGRATAPEHSLREELDALRARVRPAQQGLELARTEYAQAVRDGRVVAPTEYAATRADVGRAQAAIAGAHADLRALDPQGTARLDRVLAALTRAVDARAQAAEVDRLSALATTALAAAAPSAAQPR